MLKVQIDFEDNLYTQMLLESEKVPCLCKISDNFYIDFLESVPQVTGRVLNWRHVDIDLRVPAGAGGKYLHYKYGLITISDKQGNIYIIEELEMFVLGGGWISVIKGRDYTNVPEVEEPDWLKNL